MPLYNYNSSGVYSVSLFVTDIYGCVDSETHDVEVWPLPVVGFDVNNPVCITYASVFDNSNYPSPAAATWIWNYGDGDTDTLYTPGTTHTYLDTGTYSVTLTIIDTNGCQDSFTAPAIVNDYPHPDFTAADVCFGDTTTFVNSLTTMSSYIWHFGDGTSDTSSTSGMTHYYSAYGAYDVILIVTDAFGCVGIDTTTIFVRPQPIADFTWSDVCLGFDMSFNDSTNYNVDTISGSASLWSWSFGDPAGGNSMATNPLYNYDTSGVYSVSLLVFHLSFDSYNFHLYVIYVKLLIDRGQLMIDYNY